MATIVVVGLAIRIAGLPVVSGDLRKFLLPCFEHLAPTPGAIGDDFTDYSPPYVYLLALLTYVEPVVPATYAIKAVSIAFDLGTAVLVMRIASRQYARVSTAAVAGAGYLLVPTVAINSAYWGQADSIFTFFALLGVWSLLERRPAAGMLWYGVAFSFKLQAVFLAPSTSVMTW